MTKQLQYCFALRTTYFVFVCDPHFCHIYGEVMLVGHDYLNLFHLEHKMFKGIF